MFLGAALVPGSCTGLSVRWSGRFAHTSDPREPKALVAEADGNRTRQAGVAGLTGFEDRGSHQATDASNQGL